MKKSVGLTSFLISFLFCSFSYAQWASKPGEYYAKTQVSGAFGNHAFDREGEIIPVEDFTFYALGLYGEFGIDEFTALNASAGVGHATYGEESTVYLNPMMVGVTNQLYLDESIAVATLVRGGINTGVSDRDLSDNPVLEFRIATEFAYIGEALLQVGLSSGQFFGALGTGARYHSAYGVDLMANLTMGYSFENGIVPILNLSYNHAINAPKIINIAGSGPTRYFGFGFGVGWWLSDSRGMILEVQTAPYAISNAGAPVLGIGVQFR